MRKVSSEFINLSKKIKTQDLKLTINEGELTVQEVHLMPVNIFNSIPINILRKRKQVIAKELKYSFEGQLFKTIMQQIEITVKNASEIKGKYVDFQYGIQINNQFEYLDIGEYYIKDVEDDKNKEELIVTGYDKMLNFMIPFKQSELQLTYPCKMAQLVNRMGEVCGVEIYSTDFFNSELIVDEDFFTAQQLTYRDVLEKIAQTTLTTIFIKENKLYLCKISDSVQTLDTSFLSNLVVGEKFGPVNVLVLGRGSVEDNIESVNKDSINTNGRCEIRFDENEFIDSKREEVIDLMLQQIDGLEYYAIEASNLGLLWLEPCDVITTKDREDNPYKSIYLKASVTINTGIKGEIEAEIPDTTTTEYKVTTTEQKKTLKVERLAKKNEGLIKDLIQETTATGEKLSKVEQTVDGITQSVSEVEEKVEIVEEKADVAQEKADQVNNDLATKYYTKTETNSQIEQKSEEITSTVSKTYSTKTETSNAKKEAIDSANASTDKKLEDYSTTEEMNTAITQKADSITSTVSKTYSTKTETSTAKQEAINSANTSTDNKLKNYSTTEQMNTAITQKADEINLEVGKKVNNEDFTGANIMLAINNDTSSAGINADKIDLSGKEINLTSDDISITSDNFNVDSEGNVEIIDEPTSSATSSNPANFTVRNQDSTRKVEILPNRILMSGEASTAYMWNSSEWSYIGASSDYDIAKCRMVSAGADLTFIDCTDGVNKSEIKPTGITTPTVTQTSLAEEKKNFEKLQDNAIDIIKKIDIYKYNLKSENDTDKKHIGFVIGEDYNYSEEVTSLDNKGVDNYSFTSLCCKALQEQQEMIESLQKQIQELKEGK